MKIYKTQPASDQVEVRGMANLLKRKTNLPIVVWISQGVGLPHGPRVKANTGSGEKVTRDSFFSMTIEDNPKVVAGKPEKTLYAKELSKWIVLNQQVLLDYWTDKLEDTEEVLQQLKPLP